MKIFNSLFFVVALFFASTVSAQIYIDSDYSVTEVEEVKEFTEENPSVESGDKSETLALKIATPAAKKESPGIKMEIAATKTETPAMKVETPAVRKETAPVRTEPAPVRTETPTRPKPTVKTYEEPAAPAYSESSSSSAGMSNDDLPSWAKPGKCYARCMVSDQYEFREERVIDRPATLRTQKVPAVYETVFDTIISKPAYTRVEKIPAEYETITEEIMVAPASTKWVKGKGNRNCLSANPEDCQVMCLVEVPATYKTVTKRVLKSPAYDQEFSIPAETKLVPRRYMKEPERLVEIEIPATYKTIMKKVLVKKGSLQEWKEVLCNDKLTSEKVIEIQKALKERGYDPGPLDDVLGSQTRAALIKYQREKGLPVGNLNFETLKSLGVE